MSTRDQEMMERVQKELAELQKEIKTASAERRDEIAERIADLCENQVYITATINERKGLSFPCINEGELI